ncbi:MAG: radical SAM protein, partial [Rhodospirillaceae bacterium]
MPEEAFQGKQGFARCRFDAAALEALLVRSAGRSAKTRAALEQIGAALIDRPLSDWPSLEVALAGASDPPVSRAARDCLRDHFLHLADAPLQALYRDHFAQHPPPEDMLHADRIALLAPLQGEAQALAQAFDWEWLLAWLGLAEQGETAAHCLRRLSTLPHPVSRVNLRFTYHCNFRCAHCYNDSGPDRKVHRLALEDMRAIVRAMPRLGIDALNLTGGEPLLYPEDCCAVIAEARLREVSLYSNGWWAAEEASAAKMLDRLEAAGFMAGPGDHLKISTGRYHQPFQPIEPLLAFAEQFHARFGRPLLLDVEAQDRSEVLTQIIRYDAARRSPALEMGFRRVASLGRGADLPIEADRDYDDVTCHQIDQLVYDPDGSIRPCCGFNADNAGIRFGRHEAMNPEQAFWAMQNDPILQCLSQRSFGALADALGQSQVGRFDSLCGACQAVVGGLEDREPVLRALFSE